MATQLTLSIPDELAMELGPLQEQLGDILQLGVRQWHARQGGPFEGLADVLERLAALPTPQEVLNLRPSAELQSRIQYLLEKNREGGLNPEEENEWRQYEFVEHLVRLAKANAAMKLKHPGDGNGSDVRTG